MCLICQARRGRVSGSRIQTTRLPTYYKVGRALPGGRVQAQVQGSSSSYTRVLAHPHRHPHVDRAGRLFPSGCTFPGPV